MKQFLIPILSLTITCTQAMSLSRFSKADYKLIEAVLMEDISLAQSALQEKATPNIVWTPTDLYLYLWNSASSNLKSIIDENFFKIDNVLELISPLSYSAFVGNNELVRLLIKFGARINPIHGPFPLISAIRANHIPIVRYLIDQGAQTESIFPLHEANSADMIKLLLKHYTKLNCNAYCNAWTPLHYAIFKSNYKVVKELIQQGALASKFTEKKGLSPLHIWTSSYDNCPNIFNILIKENNINAVDENKETPLLYGIHHGNLATKQDSLLLLLSIPSINIEEVNNEQKTCFDLLLNEYKYINSALQNDKALLQQLRQNLRHNYSFSNAKKISTLSTRIQQQEDDRLNVKRTYQLLLQYKFIKRSVMQQTDLFIPQEIAAIIAYWCCSEGIIVKFEDQIENPLS